MRFRLECNDQEEQEEFYPEEERHACVSHVSLSEPFRSATKAPLSERTRYPASVSIDALLKAKQLVKPKKRNKVTLSLEQFLEWVKTKINGLSRTIIKELLKPSQEHYPVQ